MEGGYACFRRVLPFAMQLHGTINGESFTVEGKGTGDSNTGQITGKWVCTSGKMPMSWAAIAPTLGYKCFIKHPNGLPHYFQESMPHGYTQERVTRFQDDGILKTYHEIHYNRGIIMNKVTLQGDGFKHDSPVLNNGIKCYMPNCESNIPYENGVKTLSHLLFPLKGKEVSYLTAIQTTVNRPLGEGRVVRIPGYHYTRGEARLSTDVDDDSDHIILEEALEGFEYRLLSD